MSDLGAIHKDASSRRETALPLLSPAQIAGVEIALMSLLILSYTWIWQKSFKGAFLICVALYLLIGYYGHRRRGETARQLGVRTDNLAQALRLAVLWLAPVGLLALGLGAWWQTFSFPELWKLPFMFVGSTLWGTLQQYGLLAFFYRRLEDLLPGSWSPAVAAAGFFALFHLPNPFLMFVTFGLGIVVCRIYRAVPNLLAIGLAHGALSIILIRSLPTEVTFGLRVGPGFLRLLDRLQASAIGLLF